MSVLALGLLVLSGCGGPEVVEAPDPVRPVKLMQVTTGSNLIQVNLPAVIEASNTSVLTFQVGGTLNELQVVEGQRVNKGTIIGRLDQRDYRNALQQAQAQFTSANSEFERASRLLSQDAISRSVYEQREAARDVAKAALDTAQKSLDDTTLRTPFGGVIASLSVEQFENVAPAQPIAVLQTVGAAEALVQIPSKLIANSTRITPVESYITLDAAEDARITAEFLSISTQADPTTQTFSVRFKFETPEDINILPGMTGSLHATLQINEDDERAAQITVPIGSVLSEDGQTFVWVVDTEAMTVSKRPISLQDGIGEELVVLSGLEVGETIAGAGASYLFEGMQIRSYEN